LQCRAVLQLFDAFQRLARRAIRIEEAAVAALVRNVRRKVCTDERAAIACSSHLPVSERIGAARTKNFANAPLTLRHPSQKEFCRRTRFFRAPDIPSETIAKKTGLFYFGTRRAILMLKVLIP
jgi:hypothetical protein